MIPVAAPPRVRQRLAAQDGPVRVVHAGSEAWYLDVDGWAVGLLSRHAAQVPCGLRSHLSGTALFSGDVADQIGYRRDGILWLGGQAFRPVRSVDVRAPRITVSHGFRTASSATVKATPPAQVAEFVRWVVGAPPPDLDDARMASLVPALLGAGPGLTPLGDDVVCGWLSAHRAAGRSTPATEAVLDELMSANRPATTLLSATLIDCARHGEVLPEFGAWLSSWGTSDESSCLARLCAVGATSGAGLAAGANLALPVLSIQRKVSA